MKKRILTVLCAGMIVLQVTGCGAKETTENQTESTTESVVEAENETETDDATENATLYFSEIDVDNNVVLGEYKNLEVVQNQQTVTDEEVENYEGIGNCVLGYTDAPFPTTRPRKDKYIYYIE